MDERVRFVGRLLDPPVNGRERTGLTCPPPDPQVGSFDIRIL